MTDRRTGILVFPTGLFCSLQRGGFDETRGAHQDYRQQLKTIAILYVEKGLKNALSKGSVTREVLRFDGPEAIHTLCQVFQPKLG